MSVEYDELILQFVNDLNGMADQMEKNYIVTYASVGMEMMVATDHNITFIVQRKQNMWQIMGTARRLFIFKRYFPLVDIKLLDMDDKEYIRFDGLFTESLKEIPYDTDSLKSALDTYLNRCENASHEVFTKT